MLKVIRCLTIVGGPVGTSMQVDGVWPVFSASGNNDIQCELYNAGNDSIHMHSCSFRL